MSDVLRARLADAIWKAISNEFWADLPGQVLAGANFGPAFNAMTRAAVDALLSLPDIAIVELPHRNRENCWRIGPNAVWFDDLGRIRILVETIVQDADMAREFAAALLAAANTASQHENVAS